MNSQINPQLTCIHISEEPEWIKKLPDIVEIQDNFVSLLQIPCYMWYRVPFGLISKSELISLSLTYKHVPKEFNKGLFIRSDQLHNSLNK